MRRLIESSRFVIALPALASLLGGVALSLIGVWEVLVAIYNLIIQAEGLKVSVVGLLTAVDSLLLGTVLIVVGYGLYVLFVDPRLTIPEWLEIRSLDDLKAKLIGIVVTIMSIAFLSFLVDNTEPSSIMAIGVGVGVVIVSLAAFSWATSQRK
jgi:hypothetical protein